MPREPLREKIPKGHFLTPEEKETVITFDDSCDACTIYTCNKSLQLELKRKGYTTKTKDAYGITFECTKNLLTFRTLKKTHVPSGRKPSAAPKTAPVKRRGTKEKAK